VLPPANRLRRSAEFTSTVRGGSRARSGRLVVHHQPATSGQQTDAGRRAPRAGLIVGRGVGGSVARHRVSRRLRAQLAARLDRLPDSSVTVVRALPGCAGASSQALGRDLDRAFTELARRR
jgi:ribonuclease P protein component